MHFKSKITGSRYIYCSDHDEFCQECDINKFSVNNYQKVSNTK